VKKLSESNAITTNDALPIESAAAPLKKVPLAQRKPIILPRRLARVSSLLGAVWQRSKPLYRSRRFTFSPEKLIGSDSSAERHGASDGSQVWELPLSEPAGRYPWGPIELSLTCSSTKLPVTARIQCKVGEEFRDGHDVWVLIDSATISRRVVHLAAGIKRIRLAVYTDDSKFALTSFELREIGRSQRGLTKLGEALSWLARNPSAARAKIKKAIAMYKKGGFQAIKERLIRSDRYPEWIAQCDTITDLDRKRMKETLTTLPYQPLISVLLPVYNVPERFLRAVIESVRKQIYENWQLCVADDNSPSPHVKRVVAEYAAIDPRITYVFREQNGHIAEATNSAAKLATGEFIGFLDHDDELRENALYWVIKELNEHRDADLIYSDEDKITEDGIRHYPHFKSDWNPELMLCQNYVCHFTVVRRTIFEKLGGIRKGFDGAQDWDFVLRVSESTTPDKIRHIPRILYHWRVIEGSTAKATESKPYVTAAQIKAVSDYLERRGDVGAGVESLPAISMLKVTYRIPTPPLVSLIIPTHNQRELLSKCIHGILESTTYKNLEVLVVDNRSDEQETLLYLEKISEDPRVRVIRDNGPFNFARINNDAVKHARGTIFGFINNDIQVMRPDWLHEMVSHVIRQNIGAVGARLLYPNGTVQHAGVILGIGGVADHMMKHISAQSLGYFCRAILPQNLSAVTAACMLVKREAFERVGGFDQDAFAVAYNDIDFCLRLRQAGYLITYTPYAELLHHESVSRGYEDSPDKLARFQREYDEMKRRWGAALSFDPYYNPNCSADRAYFEPRMKSSQ
jgi:GT2 family glycosyltransferase